MATTEQQQAQRELQRSISLALIAIQHAMEALARSGLDIQLEDLGKEHGDALKELQEKLGIVLPPGGSGGDC